jgi:hypothetical protein
LCIFGAGALVARLMETGRERLAFVVSAAMVALICAGMVTYVHVTTPF